MRKVLIVDDEALARMDMAERLGRLRKDCRIVGQANHGRDALELIGRLSPDLVIMDIKMPVMDGIEVIRHAKQEGYACRFIVMSCFEEYSLVREALRLGADDYLLKHSCADEEIDAAVTHALLELDKSIEDMGSKRLLRKILLAQMLSLEMSPETLQTYINTGIFDGKSSWYTLVLIQGAQAPLGELRIPGYLVAKGAQEAWVLLRGERADVRAELASVREQAGSEATVTLYLQAYTDLLSFYRQYLQSQKKQPGMSRKIRQAIDYMHKHYAEPISVETTAMAIGISKTYLHQTFKAETGCSFSEWMQKYRMQKACELLVNTSLKIYEIAEMVGYMDSAYFSSTFKKVLGVSPYQFREGREEAD